MLFGISFTSVPRKQMPTKSKPQMSQKTSSILQAEILCIFIYYTNMMSSIPIYMTLFLEIEHNVALMEEDNIHNHQTEDCVRLYKNILERMP